MNGLTSGIERTTQVAIRCRRLAAIEGFSVSSLTGPARRMLSSSSTSFPPDGVEVYDLGHRLAKDQSGWFSAGE